MSPQGTKHSTIPSTDGAEIDFIETVNDLQNQLAIIGHPLNVQLPEIVVIGGQSSGKSSTLEGFVGKEFLPRGQGLVTRRPIIIQLLPDKNEYGIFAHKPGNRYTDFNKIREEIELATNEECKPNQYSMKPISVTIYSPRVLKLTVVDLPGLIKVHTRDQPEETVQTVRNMVKEYISRENTIILAVTEATADICTADSLAMAKEVDPDYLRTIGVLTKVDSMQKGTDAREILENTLYPLKRSWVAVVNRCPEDILEQRDMAFMLKKESDFFDCDLYRHLKDRMGTVNLQKLLQKTLRLHIKENLASVRIEISERLLSVQKELKQFESIIGEGPNKKTFYMNKLINMFIKDIDVKLMGYSESVSLEKLTAGAIIKYILCTEVKNNINSMSLFPSVEDMQIAILNHIAIRNCISVPSLVVDTICQDLVKRFKVPLKQSVNHIKEILEHSIKESASLLDAYPSLKNEVICIIQNWIEEGSEGTYERLESHIDAKMFYLNLNHPEFDVTVFEPVAPPAGPINMWSTSETQKKTEKKKQSKDSESKADANNVNASTSSTSKVIHTEAEIQKLLKANDPISKPVNYVTAVVIKYLEIVQKEVWDIAITYISYFLVRKLNIRIGDDLGPTIMNSANMESLLEDYDDDFRRKEELELTCKRLEQVALAIKEI